MQRQWHWDRWSLCLPSPRFACRSRPPHDQRSKCFCTFPDAIGGLVDFCECPFYRGGWQNFLGRVQAEISTDQHVAARVKGIVYVAFEAYRRDPRGVKVLILEVGRSPAGGAVNRGGAFSSVIIAASQMFVEAQRRGEIPAHLEPTLCATMLFGSIEMGLTSFVMGLLDKRDDAAIDRARDQVAETFLHGLVGARAQPAIQAVPPPAARPRTRRADS